MVRIAGLVAVVLLLFQPLAARGQDIAVIRGGAERAADLVFPPEPSVLDEVRSPRMALFKPAGDGPFPALVLFHQCGGLGQTSRKPNLSMLDWARKSVEQGYVVLLIDALGPRGVDSVCYGPKNNVVFARGVKDAFQAADHLRSLPYVDPGRVGLAGYSWGAMVGLLASSTLWGETLGTGRRFAAVVSFYPGCFPIRPPNSPPFEMARNDIDRPLLVMMGGQDTETPASDCQDRLEPARKTGAPVDLHLYPEATHCWDCAQLDGFSKTDSRGNAVRYRYDEATTLDSARRMFDFLARTMK